MKQIALRVKNTAQIPQSLLEELTSARSGMRLAANNSDGESQYDLRQPYQSDVGTWVDLALLVVSAADAAIALKNIRDRSRSAPTPTQDVGEPRQPLFLIIGGREYNLVDLSDKELEELLAE